MVFYPNVREQPVDRPEGETAVLGEPSNTERISCAADLEADGDCHELRRSDGTAYGRAVRFTSGDSISFEVSVRTSEGHVVHVAAANSVDDT